MRDKQKDYLGLMIIFLFFSLCLFVLGIILSNNSGFYERSQEYNGTIEDIQYDSMFNQVEIQMKEYSGTFYLFCDYLVGDVSIEQLKEGDKVTFQIAKAFSVEGDGAELLSLTVGGKQYIDYSLYDLERTQESTKSMMIWFIFGGVFLLAAIICLVFLCRIKLKKRSYHVKF